jgi:hypothetical protein
VNHAAIASFRLLLALLGAIPLFASLSAQAEEASNDVGVRFVEPVVQRWEIGLRFKGGDGPATGVLAVAPIPTEWPEQQVEIVAKDVSANVGSLNFRDIPPGARQMVVSIPRLAAGEEVHALLTIEVTRSAIAAPADPEAFVPAAGRNRQLAPFLAESPKIESQHPRIRKLAEELTAGKDPGWAAVEAIYSFIHKSIKYKVGELKGAVETLDDEEGDCEACTSLFVALCRAKGVPARTVWVIGHSYSEFYLEDRDGKGHWIPCQSAGSYQFGGMNDHSPIMQKGDNFRLPGYREPFRYAQATMTVKDVKGRTAPSLEQVIRQLPE